MRQTLKYCDHPQYFRLCVELKILIVSLPLLAKAVVKNPLFAGFFKLQRSFTSALQQITLKAEHMTVVTWFQNSSVVRSALKHPKNEKFIMTNKTEIKNKINRAKPYLINEFSVHKIGLFGSYSTHDQNEDSDIDILVEFRKPVGWKFFTLERYLEDLLGKKIDLITEKGLKRQFKASILKQVEYL